jgi:ABC-type Na+ efflux pump permease subunit
MPAKGQDTSMHTTYFLARLIGPVEVVLAIGILANRAVYKDVTAQLLGNPALVSITGILGLTAGLAILNAHSRWTSDWRSLITLLGWFLTLVGVFRIFAPDLVRYLSIPANNTAITVAGVLLLTSGGILTYQGYAAEPQRLRKET